MKGNAIAVVMPHRTDGRWTCRRRFMCSLCRGPSLCWFTTPGHAGDWARAHLAAAHGITAITTMPLPTKENSQ